MDLGTGGGFPGIPLAIMFPTVSFKLIDGTGKKIRVVQEVIDAVGLKNAKALQLRAEEDKEKYDFVVTRAVASLEKLEMWSKPRIKRAEKNAMPNGLIALKGINLEEEKELLSKGTYVEEEPLSNWFKESFFESKSLIYTQF